MENVLGKITAESARAQTARLEDVIVKKTYYQLAEP
jgi:hypothetical protein